VSFEYIVSFEYSEYIDYLVHGGFFFLNILICTNIVNLMLKRIAINYKLVVKLIKLVGRFAPPHSSFCDPGRSSRKFVVFIISCTLRKINY